jgi:hypothetical protein
MKPSSPLTTSADTPVDDAADRSTPKASRDVIDRSALGGGNPDAASDANRLQPGESKIFPSFSLLHNGSISLFGISIDSPKLKCFC